MYVNIVPFGIYRLLWVSFVLSSTLLSQLDRVPTYLSLGPLYRGIFVFLTGMGWNWDTQSISPSTARRGNAGLDSVVFFYCGLEGKRVMRKNIS